MVTKLFMAKSPDKFSTSLTAVKPTLLVLPTLSSNGHATKRINEERI
jgi:hypothetical protein